MVSVFRLVIIVNALSLCAYVVLPFFDELILGKHEAYILSYSGYGQLVGLPGFISWLLVVSSWLIALGLFFLFVKARVAFVFLWCVNLALSLTSGMLVETSYEVFFYEVYNLSSGVIISMAYFSRVFEKKST